MPFSLHLLLAGKPQFSWASLIERPGYDDDNLAWVKLFICIVALIALFYEASREAEGNPISRKWKKLAAATFAIIGAVSYFQYFQIGYRDFYHRWEFFHYYIGSKYYKEIGFEGIYTCAAAAEAELPKGSAGPNDNPAQEVRTRKIRDLRVNLIVDTADWVNNPGKCKDGGDGRLAFTPERWEAFKFDVAFFRRTSYGNYWRDMQKDHGYNPPPVWGLTGWIFATIHPATETYIKMLSALDVILFAGMFGAIAWAFGWRVMAIAVLFWGTQDASPFYWTGGAFLRQDWLFYAMLSACMIRRNKHFWGGFFLTYSTLLRVFPLFFFAGWGVVAVAHFYRKKKLHPLHIKLATGCIAAACVLIPASMAVHGVKAWPEFIHHISVHKGTPLTNHMGWQTIVAHRADGRMAITKDPRRMDPFETWKDMRRDRVKELNLIFRAGQALMFAMFAWACWHLKNLWIVEALGTLITTIGVELTCYYYSYFIYGAMLSKGRRPIEIALILCSLGSEWAHVKYGWFDDRFTAMSVIFLFLALFMVAIYSRSPMKLFAPQTRKLPAKPAPAE